MAYAITVSSLKRAAVSPCGCASLPLFNLRLWLVCLDVIRELLLLRIIRLLLQKHFVLGRRAVLVPGGIVACREPQMRVSHANRIELPRLVQIADGLRALLEREISLA